MDWIENQWLMMYKVIVAGSRTFDNYELLETTLVHFLTGKRPSEVEIVSGTARGADKLGERFAKEKKCKLTKFVPDWDTYGKSAGYRRNVEMANYADACIVYMKKEGSKGSQHMINIASKLGLEVVIVNF